MIKTFPHFVITALILICSCIIYAQDTDSQKQPVSKKADSLYSESQPYLPRVFEYKKAKKQKNKKNNQEPAQAVPSVAEKLSADTIITLPVSVFDTHVRFVTGFQKSDFKVFVNDKECEIDAVKTKDQPLNIILLMDTSPSAYMQNTDLQNYALAVVDQLRPVDRMIVIQFSEKLKVMTELTSDHETLVRAIEKTQIDDGTALYDTIQAVFTKLVPTISGRTALLILTDGVDTVSKRSNYMESLAAAEKSEVTVFPIYFDTFALQNKNMTGLMNRLPPLSGTTFGQALGSSKAEYDLGRLYLHDLVILSGGRAILAKEVAKGQKAALPKITTELALQYYVSFRLPEPTNIGERKQIKIRVDRPNLAVLTRGSYIAER